MEVSGRLRREQGVEVRVIGDKLLSPQHLFQIPDTRKKDQGPKTG